MQTTSDGRPKIVDIVDCTGSGDVLMSAPVKPTRNADGSLTLVGQSGRQLVLSSNWSNPSGEFRLGLKRGFDLFPKDLISRMTSDWKEKFTVKHQALLNHVQTALNSWNTKYPSGAVNDESAALLKSDLDAQLESLNAAMKDYDDAGPVYDCVLFNDGNAWRAVIDVTETGDLTHIKPLADYKLERKYSNFGSDFMLNYSVKIYDGGDVLSIVTLAGSHGTHVAAITSAYFPDDHEINGVAPGSQVVSLKIGDTRLGSMETGTGLTRALNSIVENNCQVCNMSYGEDAGVADQGRWVEMLREELIFKRRIIFVSSAGNAGPALSTAGSPGSTTSGVIGVGAYVTSEMVQAEYGLLENVPERSYTWSSQSPAYDGAQNVTTYAPGAAITSVPQYQLKNSQLMNGTSMSSPNACGNIALLISALLADGVSLSPFRLEKALINTAKNIDDIFKIGLIQTESAYEYLVKYKDDKSMDLFFEVKVQGGNRGIYLREGVDTGKLHQLNVSVTPIFKKDDYAENSLKLDYEHRLVLTTTASFAKVPECILMNSGGRDFSVRVDPSSLPAGFHYAQVQAFISNQIEKGPIFTIPVTVTKGVDTPSDSGVVKFNYTFSSGHIERRFINVPIGANWAELRLKSKGGARIPAKLVVHLLQIVPHVRHTRTEQHWYLDMNGVDPIPTKTFKVEPMKTIEVCIAQFWSSLGSFEVELEIEFHGVISSSQNVTLNGSRMFARIDVSSHLQQEKVSPSASFDFLQKSLKPTSSVIAPLNQRDLLINGKRNQELILTYTLTLAEAHTCRFRKPAVDDVLYENVFDSILYMVHDSNKRTIFFGDIYVKDCSLKKGEYTIRLQLRHDSMEILEKMKQMPLLVDIKLGSAVKLDIYGSQYDLFDAGKRTVKPFKLDAGQTKPLFIDSIVNSLPKDAKHGDLLIGELDVGCKVEGGPMFPLSLLVPPADKTDTAATNKKTDEDSIEDVLKDARLAYYEKAKKENKAAIIDALVKDFPTDIKVLLKKLNHLVAVESENDSQRASNFDSIVQATNAVQSLINISEINSKLAQKDPQFVSDDFKKQKESLDEKKKQWIDAQKRKVEVLLAAHIVSADKVSLDTVKAAYTDLQTVATVNSDIGGAWIQIAYEVANGRHGSALKTVNTWLADNQFAAAKKSAATNSSFLALFEKVELKTDCDLKVMLEWKRYLLASLKWSCWTDYETQWSRIRFPAEYSQF